MPTLLQTILIFGLFTTVLGVIGVSMILMSKDIDSELMRYEGCEENPAGTENRDGHEPSDQSIISPKICYLHFVVEKTIEAPIFVHYQLYNFFQNSRAYMDSISHDQLMG